MTVFFEKFMFKLTYIKLCYYLIIIHLATFYNQSAQIAHITRLGSFTLVPQIISVGTKGWYLLFMIDII